MDQQQLNATLATFGLVFGLISLAVFVFTIIVWWRIFSKAGYSGALSLLIFVPIANIVMLCILAFAEWPILRELNQLRQMAARNSQFPANPQYPQSPQYPQNPQYRG